MIIIFSHLLCLDVEHLVSRFYIKIRPYIISLFVVSKVILLDLYEDHVFRSFRSRFYCFV